MKLPPYFYHTVRSYADDVLTGLSVMAVFMGPYLAFMGHPGLAFLLIFFAEMQLL